MIFGEIFWGKVKIDALKRQGYKGKSGMIILFVGVKQSKKQVIIKDEK